MIFVPAGMGSAHVDDRSVDFVAEMDEHRRRHRKGKDASQRKGEKEESQNLHG